MIPLYVFYNSRSRGTFISYQKPIYCQCYFIIDRVSFKIYMNIWSCPVFYGRQHSINQACPKTYDVRNDWYFFNETKIKYVLWGNILYIPHSTDVVCYIAVWNIVSYFTILSVTSFLSLFLLSFFLLLSYFLSFIFFRKSCKLETVWK